MGGPFYAEQMNTIAEIIDRLIAIANHQNDQMEDLKSQIQVLQAESTEHTRLIDLLLEHED